MPQMPRIIQNPPRLYTRRIIAEERIGQSAEESIRDYVITETVFSFHFSVRASYLAFLADVIDHELKTENCKLFLLFRNLSWQLSVILRQHSTDLINNRCDIPARARI